MKQMKFSTTKWFQSVLKHASCSIIIGSLVTWVPEIAGKTVKFDKNTSISICNDYFIKIDWCK